MRTVAVAVSVVAALGLSTLGACAQPGLSEEATHAAMEDDHEIGSCLERDGWDHPLEDALRRRLEDPEFNSAVEKCAAELDIEVPGPDDTVRLLNEAYTHTIECLRREGWVVPEPSADPHGLLHTGNIAELVPADDLEDFQADFDWCSASR